VVVIGIHLRGISEVFCLHINHDVGGMKVSLPAVPKFMGEGSFSNPLLGAVEVL
jgi:hypothetical protein